MDSLVTRVQTKDMVDELLKKIKIIEVRNEFFDKTDSSPQELTPEETKTLIEVANVLASSSDVENRKKALQIVTTLPLINTSRGVGLSFFFNIKKTW